MRSFERAKLLQLVDVLAKIKVTGLCDGQDGER